MKNQSSTNQNKNNAPTSRSQKQKGIHNSNGISFIDFGRGRIEEYHTIWKAENYDSEAVEMSEINKI